MPITIDEFESGDLGDDESVPFRVATFLAENCDHAFTRSEIAEALEVVPNVVGGALSQLNKAELVRHRGRYWAITDNTERLQSAYNLHRLTELLNEQEEGA